MPNVLERLRDYFQNISDVLDGEKNVSSIFPNNPDAGSTREDLFVEFLQNHLPKRCEVVKGGFVFDASGNESKQIDILITNDATLQFKQNKKSFNTIEGTLGVVSVKTRLDKNGLYDALDNILSLPNKPDLSKKINPNISNPQLVNTLPYKVIFAFDGIKLETLSQHLLEYMEQKRSSREVVDLQRTPHLIIVNNQYLLVRPTIRGSLSGSDGKPLSHDRYSTFSKSINQYIGALSLFLLLMEIQRLANVMPHLLWDISQYYDNSMATTYPKE